MNTEANNHHDVIIVGARVAGAATAMLLAQHGLDVLCVERSTEGSDTLSTHALVPTGVRILRSWGLMESVQEAETPDIERVGYHYDVGGGIERLDFRFDAASRLSAPRRTVIDPILVGAARAAGAEFRFETKVVEILQDRGRVEGVKIADDDGEQYLTARVVVGADGGRSLVARSVNAGFTFTGRYASASVIGYFGEWDEPAYDTYFSDDATVGAIATNDRTVCAFAMVSQRRFQAEIRRDTAAGFWNVVEQVSPGFASELRARPQGSRFRSFPGHHGYTRTGGGAGWLLVGDAGAFADPVTSHGMTSALRDAMAAGRFITELFNGRSEAACWGDYTRQRDHIAHGLIATADPMISYRHPMAQVQEAHKKMAAVLRSEAQLIADNFDLPAVAA